jgi:NAD(P)-dependent dehydrogenase (short-subunit alcohol dehydrogenase family)
VEAAKRWGGATCQACAPLSYCDVSNSAKGPDVASADTRALAVELAPTRVNCVSPGLARTPRWDALSEANRQALYEREERRLADSAPPRTGIHLPLEILAKPFLPPDLTRCPLYPKKRTWLSTIVMSALCQKQTYAVQQSTSAAIAGIGEFSPRVREG